MTAPGLRRRDRRRRGGMLLAAGLLLTLLLAAGGLMVDIYRLLGQRNALQARLDAAALAAVLELDGTVEGVARARREAETRSGSTDSPLSELRCEFAADPEGPWEEYPSQAMMLRLVRVTGLRPVPLSLVRAVVNRHASNVWASASAEQRPKTSFNEGLFPYSPIAPGQQAPHFGLSRGAIHTLRWAESPSLAAGNVCAGDAGQAMIDLALAEPEKPAGFIEMTVRQNIRKSILLETQTYVRRLGDGIQGSRGVRPLEVAALVERIRQDTDTYSRNYAEYAMAGRGNGRRLVAAPIHSPHPDRRIVQIGAFFLLPPAAYLPSGDSPFCAEYIGTYVQGGKRRGPAESGFHVAVLLQK